MRELSLELVKRDHSIGIVAPDTRKLPGVKHYVVKPPQDGIFVGHPELPNAKKFEDMSGRELGEIYTMYLKETINAVADFNPEIIHVFHTAFLPGIGRVIKILFGIKFIITTHGSDLSYLMKDRRFMGLIRDANAVARFITANSEFTKKWYLRMFGYNLKSKTSVVLGGVHLEKDSVDTALTSKINKKYGLTGKKVVLFTGRLTSGKGVRYLVGAANRINGTVVIVGDGPKRPILEEMIRKRGLKNVIMTGYIEDTALLRAFYQRASIYIAPSIWDEPLGLTILEAMAAHTPVIATKKGGIVSIIKDGVNGILIRARNSKQIAEEVNKLLADDAKRERMSWEAYKTIQEKFTWQKIATKFEEIYKKFRYSTREYLAVVRGQGKA